MRVSVRAQPAILVIACLLVACEPPEPGPAIRASGERDSRADRIETGLVPLAESGEPRWGETAALRDRMASYRVPAVGIAVIDNFEIVWARGYGQLEAGKDAPADARTLFHAGSIAKPVSTAALLILAEEGRLDLDADVNTALSSWHLAESDATTQEKVTPRRLMSHSAGLEDGLTNRSAEDAIPSYTTPGGVAPTVALEGLLEASPGLDVDGPTRVTSVPGSRYRYANADYIVLELLAVDITGKPFARFMSERILTPLEMTSSTYEQPLPPDLRTRAAFEHDHSGAAFPGERLHFPMRAAGGLWTTPSDLGRFTIALMDAWNGRSERLLSRATATEMLSPQIGMPENPLAESAGLGIELGGEGDELYFQHTGATWGSSAILWAYPARGQGAVIMTNSATGSFLRIEILLAIAAEYDWPIAP